jgi:hypothetical protein
LNTGSESSGISRAAARGSKKGVVTEVVVVEVEVVVIAVVTAVALMARVEEDVDSPAEDVDGGGRGILD